MRQGGMLIATVAILTLSACLGGQGKLEIRSVDRGLRAGRQPVPYRVAEAYGQLALGNVALALEGFRVAAREDPASVDALAGMAQCYDRMGRFDLSRRYYEQALAEAPRNSTLLALFSASLELQGLHTEAAAARAEMAVAAASPPAASAPVGKSVTIALAPAPAAPARDAPATTIAPVGKSVTIALAPLPPVPAPSRGPRVERLSLNEVALITGEGPRWERPETVQPVRARVRAPRQGVEQLGAMPVRLRVLNAARVDKLAARTRSYLGRFGWRDILVGDAAVARPKSLILYPQAARAEASKLSSRFGFPMTSRADVRQLTILLGRDAAGHPALRPAP